MLRFFFRFKFSFLFISIENSPCRGSKVSRDPGSSVGDVTLVMIVDLLLIFPLEKWGDSIFPPYMAELFLCSKFQHIFQNIFQNRKNKSKLISRFFNSSHVGSEATPGRSRNEPFSLFFRTVL